MCQFLSVASALALPCLLTPTAASAKIPGAVHCYNDICHRVRTVEETQARRGIVEPVVASFYDSPENDRFNPRLETSSGTQFEPYADDNAASPIHPDGTVLLVWSPVTRHAAVVRVNNAGPYYPGRTLDVSRGVAERLGFRHGGVMQLLTTVISAPTEPEAHYVRGRVYPKVRGYLGQFDNIALASFQEPIARSLLFKGLTPLPSQALGSSSQIVMDAAAEHFRLTELALTFQAAPGELIAPPETEAQAAALNPQTVAVALADAPGRAAVQLRSTSRSEPDQNTPRARAPRTSESAALLLPADPSQAWFDRTASTAR